VKARSELLRWRKGRLVVAFLLLLLANRD
jgi:hypothetical protein